jgi:hypothetical protein
MKAGWISGAGSLVPGSLISQWNQENERQLDRSSGAGALVVGSSISQSNQSYLQTLEPGVLEAGVEHLVSSTILSLMAVMVTPGMSKRTENPWAIQAGRRRHLGSHASPSSFLIDWSQRSHRWCRFFNAIMTLGLLGTRFTPWSAVRALWWRQRRRYQDLERRSGNKPFIFLGSFSWQHGSLRKDGERGGASHCVMTFLERGVANAL